MADINLCFSVRWAGSNKPIASRLVFSSLQSLSPQEKGILLQKPVGALVNIDPQDIKILLGSPAGPQLTPVLFTLATVRAKSNIEDLPSHKAMVKAWSSLTPDQVFNVFVTQHTSVALAVNNMARLARSNKWNYCTYRDLPLSLRRSPVVALAALNVNDRMQFTFPDELKANKQFALDAISQTQGTLGLFSSTLRDDEDVVLKAVTRYAGNMWYASARLRTSKEFVLDAVSVNGLCICGVAPDLKANKEVALAAVRQNAAALQYVCETLKLKTNRNFALAAISRTRANTILQHFDASLYNDEEVVLKAVERNDKEMRYASSMLATSRTFVLKAVSVNGLCINGVLPEFQSDKQVALAAVRQNTAALWYVCDTLRADKDIQEACKAAKQHHELSK